MKASQDALLDPNIDTLLRGVALITALIDERDDSPAYVETSAAWDLWETELRALHPQSSPSSDEIPLADLIQRFHFSRFELQVILLALAMHIEPRMRDLLSQRGEGPTVRLAMARFCPTPAERVQARAHFLPSARLIRHRIIKLNTTHHDEREGLLTRQIGLTTPTLRYLLNEHELTEQLAKIARLHYPSVDLLNVILDPARMAQVRQLVENHRHYRQTISDWGFDQILPYGKGLSMLFSGPPGTGKTLLAHALAAHARRAILSLSAADLPRGEGIDQLLGDLLNEAAMRDAIVLIDECDTLLGPEDPRKATAFKALEEFEGILILVTNHPHRLDEGLERRVMYHLPFEVPSSEVRRQVWEVHIPPEVPLEGEINLDILANSYDFSGGTIKNAILFAVNLALAENPAKPILNMELLEAGCRAQLHYALEDLSIREKTHLRLKDIVLSPEAEVLVDEILAACRNQKIVLNAWGFGRTLMTGKGITCLFDGPPGTGKTLCAEILAGELDRPLYRVNIPRHDRRDAHDSERNIRAIFQQARISHAILLFDEADSLFSARVTEGDLGANRDATLEINLLLQEIERFPGIVILTSNFFGSLDKALVRRIQFRVSFQEPSAAERLRIWHTLTPPEAPLDPEVDFQRLAEQFEMTGGMIKNAIVRAAYLACDRGDTLTQEILESSCLREYAAAGRVARTQSQRRQADDRIPEGAIELPEDWKEKGIDPALLTQAGIDRNRLPRG